MFHRGPIITSLLFTLWGISLAHAQAVSDTSRNPTVDVATNRGPTAGRDVLPKDAPVVQEAEPVAPTTMEQRRWFAGDWDSSAGEAEVPAAMPGMAAILQRLLAGVLLASALFISLLFFGGVKLRNRRGVNTAGSMELLDTLALAPRCSLHLVRVCDQVLVVGRDAAGLQQMVNVHSAFENYLGEATPEDVMAAGAGQTSGSMP